MHLQESLVRTLLHFDQVGDLDRGPDLGEGDSLAGSEHEAIGHIVGYPFSRGFTLTQRHPAQRRVGFCVRPAGRNRRAPAPQSRGGFAT